MSQPSVVTRRLLAGAVFAAPLLIAVNALFHPPIEPTGPGALAGAQAGPARWFAVHIVAATGALAAVAAAFGLRLLTTRRGRRLAAAGVVIATVGNLLLAMAFAVEASVLRLAATAPIDASAAGALAEAYGRSPEFFAVPVAVLLGAIGSALLAAALLASRSVPRWQPATYLVATLATLAAAPGSPLGPIAFGVVAVASLCMAARIVRADDDSRAAPLPQPAAAG